MTNPYKQHYAQQEAQYADDDYVRGDHRPISDAENPNHAENQAGYMDSLKDTMAGLGKKAQDLYNYGENYKWFVLAFTIGCFFIFLSLFFLPVFPIMPKKTATLFNVGTLLILFSFGI